MNDYRSIYANADAFLNDRRDFLEVRTIETDPGCHDIFLKLDGGYSVLEEAEAVAESFAVDVRHLLGKTGRTVRVIRASEVASPAPVDFRPWVLDPDTFVLRIEDVRRSVIDGPGDAYEVDLEECLTSAQVLDWIMQVAQKTWATDAVLAGLVRAVNEVLNPQAHLCSFGKPKTLTRAQVRALVDYAGPSQKRHRECPVCGKSSVLVRSLDRYMHMDGSSNERCWLAICREDVELTDPDDVA